jgi:GT2 family glycosyltransferase
VGIGFADELAAARQCVQVGRPAVQSPSPLLVVADLPRAVQDAWRAGRVGVVLAFLRRAQGPVGPLFDARRTTGAASEKAAHPGGALGLFVDRAGPDTPLPVPDGHPSPPPTWGAARLALIEHVRGTRAQMQTTPPGLPDDQDGPESLVVQGERLVGWDELARRTPERDQATVSVVIPTYRDWRMTAGAVGAVIADARQASRRVEVVLVDNGSPAEVGRQLVARFLTEPAVHYRRLPHNLNFAIGCNVGFAETTGSTVVFLNNDTVVRRGWLEAMLPHLEDPAVRGVQPLLLFPDDTVQSAGTVFCDPGFLPVHLLAGHPPEDAQRLSQRPFAAVTAAAMAVRATEFASLRGFDPVFVNGMEDIDYCLRSAEAYGGGFLVEPRARVTHLQGRTSGRNAHVAANRRLLMHRWRGRLPGPEVDRFAELGLTVAHLASDGQQVSAALPVVIRRSPDLTAARPRLRWGVKSSAAPGATGDDSEDARLADSLAGALRRLGQEVVTYRQGAHASPASYLDDVVLGIRTGEAVVPHPGKLNILWLGSGPDEVGLDQAEAAGFDLVRAPQPARTLDDQALALVTLATARLQGRDTADG